MRERGGGERQTDRETKRETDRDRQTDRQAGRQTDRQTETEREKQRERDTEREGPFCREPRTVQGSLISDLFLGRRVERKTRQ